MVLAIYHMDLRIFLTMEVWTKLEKCQVFIHQKGPGAQELYLYCI